MIIVQVRQWLKEVVIGFNFCPFARREFESGRIRYSVIDDVKSERITTTLLDELRYLDNHPHIETTLLIFADSLRNFYDYLALLDVAQQALQNANYEGIFQLASFHPDYVFEGEQPDDASNYTNRSPFPIIHLLRESSVERARASGLNVDQIPEYNKKLAREKGVEFWRSFLSQDQP